MVSNPWQALLSKNGVSPLQENGTKSILEGEDYFPQGFQGNTCIYLNIRMIAAIITLFFMSDVF